MTVIEVLSVSFHYGLAEICLLLKSVILNYVFEVNYAPEDTSYLCFLYYLPNYVDKVHYFLGL